MSHRSRSHNVTRVVSLYRASLIDRECANILERVLTVAIDSDKRHVASMTRCPPSPF
jgi:hypothetical protein